MNMSSGRFNPATSKRPQRQLLDTASRTARIAAFAPLGRALADGADAAELAATAPRL